MGADPPVQGRKPGTCGHRSTLPGPVPREELTCPCRGRLLVVPASFSVSSFVPPVLLPALLLYFEECSTHCSWAHGGPSGTRHPPPIECTCSMEHAHWGPWLGNGRAERAWEAEGLEMASSFGRSRLLSISKTLGRLSSQGGWPGPLEGSAGTSLSVVLHLLSSSEPPTCQRSSPSGPQEVWTWGVLTPQRLALEGMFSAKADGPWRLLCALQPLGVALSPSGCIVVGPGLWRKRSGWSCLRE